MAASIDKKIVCMDEVMVSVCMISYNHGEFIRESLMAVLMQRLNYKLEIIIADDASSDNSSEIIDEIITSQSNASVVIQYTRHSQNMGMMANFKWALQQCKGKYIALCEGDDYWTDPDKLQRQIDFLEANNEFSICYHRVKELHSDGSITPEELNVETMPGIYTIADLADKNLMHTASVIFRNSSAIQNLPEWFLQSPVGDYALHMLNAREGKIYYMPEMMAVYRRHSSGVWSTQGKSKMFLKWVKVLSLLIHEFSTDNVIAKRLFYQKLSILEYLYYNSREDFESADLKQNMFMPTAYFELEARYKRLQTESQEMAKFIKAGSLLNALLIKSKQLFYRN